LDNVSKIRVIQRQFRPDHIAHEAYTEDI
jgi:hypothetical protein